MDPSHSAHVQDLLSEAEAAHRSLLAAVPESIAEALPVDAQGVTRAIDYLAAMADFSSGERRRLVQPHAVNPAVLHARVFGGAPLTADTVLGAFVDGARVRASALITLADSLGDDALLARVRGLLIDHPLPAVDTEDDNRESIAALRDAYSAQERAAVMIAGYLDRAKG